MALKITKGRRPAAARVVVYGTEGIGKTTLAAQFPGALILDTEDGARHVDCHAVELRSWLDIDGAVIELARDSQGYQTVVIDSADWAERRLIDHLLNQSGKKSIEDFGFGKGYVLLQERVGKFLENCDALVRSGINVVFVAHSKVVRCSPPDQTDGYDRYELKLTKQVAPLLREWCDLLLFCNYRTRLVDGSDGRKKAKGGSERVMCAQRSAAYDAKNRYGLPAEMPMGLEPLASVFAGQPTEPPAAANVPALMTKASAAIAKAGTAEELRRVQRRIDKYLADGVFTTAQWEALTDQLAARAEACAQDIEAEVSA